MRHAIAHANGVAECYTYSHIHSNSNSYGDVYSYCDGNVYSYCDGYGDLYSYGHSHSYGHSNCDCGA